MLPSDDPRATPGTAPPIIPALQQWEYTTHTIAPKGVLMMHLASVEEMNEALAVYGAQGWELASSMVQQYFRDGAYRVILIFKRPKQIP